MAQQLLIILQFSALRPDELRLSTLRLSALRPNVLRLSTFGLSALRPRTRVPRASACNLFFSVRPKQT